MNKYFFSKYALLYSLYVLFFSLTFFSIVSFVNNKTITYLLFAPYTIIIFVIINSFYSKIKIISEKAFNEKLKRIEKNLKNENIEEWSRRKTQEIAQLKENEKFRKEFIGNVAHELKTPVFNIQGFISTLLEGAIEDPQVNIKFLERTDRNIQRLIAIIKDLDTISKLETGQIIPEMQKFDIVGVIKEVIDILEVNAVEYGIKLLFNAENHVLVFADKEKITEVLHNLMLNSIIYGKKNGKTEIFVVEKKRTVYISVKDNGIGITQDNIKHIFERFFRVDKSRSRERGGSGLGLAIVKHIIDAHNQSVTVKSKVGEGTTFIFSLSKPPDEKL